MKKLLLLSVVLFSCTSAFAQLEQGSQMIGLHSGLGFQLQKSGVTYDTDDSHIDWGHIGVAVGGNYFYSATSHLAVGFDFSFASFNGDDINFGGNNSSSSHTRLYNPMLAGRFTINPQHKVRFYLPAGAGLTIARQTLDIDYNNASYTQKHTEYSLGWFVGVGMEAEIAQSGWSVGLESRLSFFRYDEGKLTREAPAPITANGKSNLSYVSAQLTLSKRF